MERIWERVEASKSFAQLRKAYKTEGVTVHLEEMVGGALSLYAATLIRKVGGVHLFVAEDRDAAAYMLNDFYALLDESRVLFFPTSYKKSILYRKEDAQGVVQRTAVLNALRSHQKGYLVICTYPEALAERVADEGSLTERMLTLKVGQEIGIAQLQEQLEELGFEQVDFVYEPGQFSRRGGIVDVFSYAESRPYRIDFFGDEIDSVRRFNISNQLSFERTEQAEIIPNMNADEAAKVS